MSCSHCQSRAAQWAQVLLYREQEKERYEKASACDLCGKGGGVTGNYLDVMIGDAIYYICEECAKKIETKLKLKED